MGWRDEPEIRDLEPYAKKHGLSWVVVFGVNENGEQFSVTTYGRTRGLCGIAKNAGKQLWDMVTAGKWPQF